VKTREAGGSEGCVARGPLAGRGPPIADRGGGVVGGREASGHEDSHSGKSLMAVRAVVTAPEMVLTGSVIAPFYLERLTRATPHRACYPLTTRAGMTR
jgi:hypothetical protein